MKSTFWMTAAETEKELNRRQIPQLPMREYTVEVLIVPPIYEMQLTGAKIERRTVTIKGYSLKDAKRRAGIQ